MPDIVGFSIRENPSQIYLVEQMREWLVNHLIPYVNTSMAYLSDEWKKYAELLIAAWDAKMTELEAEVAAAVAEMHNQVELATAAQHAAEAARDQAEIFASQAAAIQDAAIAIHVGNDASATNTALRLKYATKAFQDATQVILDGLDDRFDLKLNVADFTDYNTGAGVDANARRYHVVNVKDKPFNAVAGEDPSNIGSTVKIQAAIDWMNAIGGGTVLIDDVYWIKAHDETVTGGNGELRNNGGLVMKDNVTIEMVGVGELKAITNGEKGYNVIRCNEVSNVTIRGGKITGDLYSHTGSTGEFGYGIVMWGGTNILIENILITDTWGDGVIIHESNILYPENITLRNVMVNGCRRQGLSITGGRKILVDGGWFNNAGVYKGTLPMNGIDIEPWNNILDCSDIVIRNVLVKGNKGMGISVYMLGTKDVRISDCIFDGNQSHQYINNASGPNITLENSTFRNTVVPFECVHLAGGDGKFIRGNTFDGKLRVSVSAGTTVENMTNVVIDGNRFVSNQATTVVHLLEINEGARRIQVTNNYFENLGLRGIGIWSRQASVPNLFPNNILVANNTFVNMSAAVSCGVTKNLSIVDNSIDASAGAALSFVQCDDLLIANNRIKGSNLVSATGAISITGTTQRVLVDGNKIDIDPYTTVTETRRGTDVFYYGGASITNMHVRNTLYSDGYTNIHAARPAPHVGCYLEVTPGVWQTWP